MSTELVKAVVEEGNVQGFDDKNLKEIVCQVIVGLDSMNSRDWGTADFRQHARNVVEVLRDHARADEHVGKKTFTRHEKLEWAGGQILSVVDGGDFDHLNTLLNHLTGMIESDDFDEFLDDVTSAEARRER